MFKNNALSRVATLGLLAALSGCGGQDSSGGPSIGQGGGKGGGLGGSGNGTGSTGNGTGSTGNGTGSTGNGTGSTGNSGFGGGTWVGPGTTQPPGFVGTPGSTGFKGLTPGCGPETAQSCTNTCETKGGGTSTVIRPPASLCFGSSEDPTPDDPIAMIEQVVEELNGKKMVHLRVTFDPTFVDNTYGTNAVGWDHGLGTGGSSGSGGSGSGGAMGMPGKDMPGMMMPGKGKSGHTFDDLVGSDHVELLLTDGTSATVMDFKLDYITGSTSGTTCGYKNLGVSGGEGKMITGNASAIIAATSSLDRNLNGCGYCLTEDSPATDSKFTPNSMYPNWDYRVVYEVWLDASAFGSAGFGQAYVTFVHASPSKLENNTVTVTPGGCPPGWDSPLCSGGKCNTSCPPNEQLYLETEGQSFCTPIPFAGYPNMAPCPSGYALDQKTEGRYCLPTK